MTPWQWWCADTASKNEGEWPCGGYPTRDEAFAVGLREYGRDGGFWLIEARSSTDARYADGAEEIVPFVRSRNLERVETRPRP